VRLTSTVQTTHGRRLLAILLALALLWAAQTSGAYAKEAQAAGQPPDRSASASLVQCVTAPLAAERSATFAGEMTAIPGITRMSMRIEVLERLEGETSFHAVIAPGLGVWRSSEPGVKIYKYLKQVANLSAPAVYRGAVTFRWLGPHGRVIKRTERITRSCKQPEPSGASGEATAPSDISTGTSPARTTGTSLASPTGAPSASA
jgi:hypothetical protein